MKKIIYTVVCGLGLSLASCSDYLDTDKYFNDTLMFDSIWVNKGYTEGWLATCYSSIFDHISKIDMRKDNCGFLFMADDLIYGDWLEQRTNRNQFYQNGEYTPSDQGENDPWGRFYEGIRRTSLFITNIDKCMEMSQKERADAKAQARFVRAYIYYKLIERFGPVPILPEEGLDVEESYVKLSTPRNSMQECTDYVSEQLAIAATNLPETRNKSDIMRATKGIALAIRAKMLILAASPLYNSEKTPLYQLKDDKSRQLVENVMNEEKWAKAAAAAKEVIDMGIYELYTAKINNETVVPPSKAGYSDADFPQGWANIDPFLSYQQVFNGDVVQSQIKEIIWANANKDQIVPLIEHCIPYYQGGWNCIAVTQKQVDAYQMADGRDITNSSTEYPYITEGFYDPAKAEKPCNYAENDISMRYVHREPRFYVSIGYNGKIWGCTSITEGGTKFHNQPAIYYKGERDGKNLAQIDNHVYTGCTMYKFYFEEDANNKTGAKICNKFEPIVRYAEVLLWYAEAMNHLTKEYSIPNFTGESAIVVSRDPKAMHDCIRPIRVRVGLPDYEDNVYENVSAFEAAIKHERQVELFGEAKRYLDLNRWLDSMKEQNEPIRGCNMEMSSSNEQKQRFYTPVIISSMKKSFIERQYLWPIHTNEMKRNPRLTQAPGWK
ncbi:RagB/SusD family nutrient uptake outer membrane protein [Bacteroides sp.]|uniref:RagB/SusD family nutrient uptake outer membrane protein n=1 Tax=Bacteroides sp. TaxID=29523 RepID=UPI002634A0B3|nr:RagB/SusD family nutrient uptake outer membrane protein [Bacteroides sp.]MDD3036984.1 RagB/SusD family nutrient uptake outer membrane protein [Bacteroides sp.]